MREFQFVDTFDYQAMPVSFKIVLDGGSRMRFPNDLMRAYGIKSNDTLYLYPTTEGILVRKQDDLEL